MTTQPLHILRPQPAADLRPLQILRPKQVADLIGIHRVTLHRWVKLGDFPAPNQYGPNTIGWPARDIDAWIEERSAT